MGQCINAGFRTWVRVGLQLSEACIEIVISAPGEGESTQGKRAGQEEGFQQS